MQRARTVGKHRSSLEKTVLFCLSPHILRHVCVYLDARLVVLVYGDHVERRGHAVTPRQLASDARAFNVECVHSKVTSHCDPPGDRNPSSDLTGPGQDGLGRRLLMGATLPKETIGEYLRCTLATQCRGALGQVRRKGREIEHEPFGKLLKVLPAASFGAVGPVARAPARLLD